MRYTQSLPSNSFSSKNVPHLTEKRYKFNVYIIQSIQQH